MANAISIPLTGWLAKRVGEVKLFLWSTIAFAIASWACAVSSSLNMLIFFRVIQGIVAGPLIPLSQSLLLNNYPPAKRSIALALWSMTVIVAPICGPILGGYISDNYHWGWIFCFFMPLTTITLSGLPPERLAAASSLSNFTRTLAGSIGTSITMTMWTNRESMHHAQLTESVNPFNPNAQAMYSQLEGLGMTQQQASGWIAQQITNQGLIISANEIFWMSAGIFLVLLGLVWFAKPPFGAGGGGGGAH